MSTPRIVADNTGQTWTVSLWSSLRAVRPMAFVGPPPQLRFERNGEQRRLSEFPRDWYSLPDDELIRLCERAEVVAVA